MSKSPPAPHTRSLVHLVARYQKPSLSSSLFQLCSTAGLLTIVWALMLWSLELSYLLTLGLAIPASCLLIRLFIFQHDCGHGSFFRSRSLNRWVGSIIGVVTLVPYDYWRRCHAIHHATSGNLDRRELGDVATMTVNEYRAASAWQRLRYRLYRNPLVMFGVGPFYQFVLKHRFPLDIPWSWRREWTGVMLTNLALGLLVFGMSVWVGFERFLMVQAPITIFAGSIGIWLFYVQHQFEDTYWRNAPDWAFEAAASHGSSLYDLHPILHWLTGNIGYHHIHHLASRIPNYRLRRCYLDNPELQQVTKLGLLESLRCAKLKLWDEEQGRLIGFREFHSRSWLPNESAGLG